jgi:hypothetical protein
MNDRDEARENVACTVPASLVERIDEEARKAYLTRAAWMRQALARAANGREPEAA